MSRNQWTKMGMAVCLVVLAAAAVMNLTGLFGGSPFGYAHAEKYTAGEASISGPVRNLDIDWTNGKVNLAYHSENTVTLQETSDRAIPADLQLRWWLDGDTLRVRYDKGGFRLGFDQQKELTVTLPNGTALDEVSIHATSGDLNVPALEAKTLRMETTSGDIHAEAKTRSAEVGATSGDITLKLQGEAESVTVGTTSGNIGIEAEKARKIKASSTSGGIGIAAREAQDCEAGATSGNVYVDIQEAGKVEIGTTSGGIQVSLAKFASLKTNSTSGQVKAALSEEPGFTAEIESVSGSIDYGMPLSRSGDKYVCGDGSGKAEIGTTSGNIQLSGLEK